MFHFLYLYIVTPIVVFLVGYILLRFMGKKAVSEMTGFELLAVLILGTAISEPVVTKQLGIASYYAATIAFLYIGFSYLRLNNRLNEVMDPKPTVLIRGGDIQEKGLKKARMTTKELIAELRKNGYAKTSDVEMATLEKIGNVTVIPKSDARPIQASDLQFLPSPAFIPIPLIMDGKINDHNVTYLQKDRDWLYQQLQAYNLSKDDIQHITLAVYNQQGAVEVDTKNRDGHQKGPSQYKPGD